MNKYLIILLVIVVSSCSVDESEPLKDWEEISRELDVPASDQDKFTEDTSKISE